MREIKNEKLLRYYLEQYHIEDIFDTKNLPFQLFEYEKGEMLNICHAPKDYLKFIVNGEWKVFYDSSMGRRFVVSHKDSFVMLGDVEFCSASYMNNWQEVCSTLHCIELPLAKVKEILMNDNRFLRYLLKNLSEKMMNIRPIRDCAVTLEEKVLYYLRYESEEHCISNVSKTAEEFHQSRRQLHRVLKKLADEKVILKQDNKYVLTRIDNL